MILPHGLALAAGWLLRVTKSGWAGVGKGLTALSHHTGVPVVILAALALVVSFRIARRASRLAVELVFALGAVMVAMRLGWIRF